jgi:hypothetical protein
VGFCDRCIARAAAVLKESFRDGLAYTSALWSFGSRQRLKAAAVSTNRHPTFHRRRTFPPDQTGPPPIATNVCHQHVPAVEGILVKSGTIL